MRHRSGGHTSAGNPRRDRGAENGWRPCGLTTSGLRVQAIGRRPQQAPDGALVHYERHRPEQTTVYRSRAECGHDKLLAQRSKRRMFCPPQFRGAGVFTAGT